MFVSSASALMDVVGVNLVLDKRETSCVINLRKEDPERNSFCGNNNGCVCASAAGGDR